MKPAGKIILIFFLASLLFSCRKDIGKANWDISVMSPLINTQLGINNLLTDSLLQTNPDSSVKIVYNTTLYNFSVDSLVNIPDTITRQVFHIPFDINAAPGQQLINNTDNKNLDLGNAQITKIIIKSGYINLRTKNSLKEKTLCKYQLPGAKLNGVPFEIIDLVPAADNNGPSTFSRKVNISGYAFDLTGPYGNSFNILTSIINAKVDPNGDTVPITHLDSLQVLVSFEGVVVDYAKGFFGTQQFQSGQQYSAFDLFNKITSGNLGLENINLKLTVNNGFGMDASLLVHEIKSVNTKTNTTVSLNSSIIGSTINVNRANETYNPANPVLPSTLTFNLNNSNFKQLIENLPGQLEYSLDIMTDPLGNVSSGNDFIYNNYGFKADLDLEIPLSFIAHDLTLKDTVSFNLSKPSGYEINNGTLTLIADNGFPLSASSQIYLLNDNNSITDSLITFNNTIISAPLDINNKVVSKERSIIKILVSGQRIERLYSAKKMIVVVRFNTANQPQYIKIFSNYFMNIKLTGDFDMTVNEN